MHVWDITLHYDEEFSDTQLLNDVINDECMKTYACMLPRVTCEGCVRSCHMNDLRWKYRDLILICSFTSGYFPFYNDVLPLLYDEYGRVHYDDDHHHALHDISGFAVP